MCIKQSREKKRLPATNLAIKCLTAKQLFFLLPKLIKNGGIAIRHDKNVVKYLMYAFVLHTVFTSVY